MGGVVLGASRPPLATLNLLPLRQLLTGMPQKPQQPPPPTKTKWHVFKLAAKRQWVGEIEAVDEREAIEIAAKEFKQPAKKLMAGERPEPKGLNPRPKGLKRGGGPPLFFFPPPVFL